MVARDIILVVAVLGVMAFGFFVIKRLDKFLDENRKRIEHKKKKRIKSHDALCSPPTGLIKSL